MSDLFADRLGTIVLADPVVCFDFLRLNDFDAELEHARRAPSTRLVIPSIGLCQVVDRLDRRRSGLLRQVQVSRFSRPRTTSHTSASSAPQASVTAARLADLCGLADA